MLFSDLGVVFRDNPFVFLIREETENERDQDWE